MQRPANPLLALHSQQQILISAQLKHRMSALWSHLCVVLDRHIDKTFDFIAGKLDVDGAGAVCDFSCEEKALAPSLDSFAEIAVGRGAIALFDIFFASEASLVLLGLSNTNNIAAKSPKILLYFGVAVISLEHLDEQFLHLPYLPAHKDNLTHIFKLMQLPLLVSAELHQISHVSMFVVVLEQVVAAFGRFEPVCALVLESSHVVQAEHYSRFAGEGGQFAYEQAEVYRPLLIAIAESAYNFELAIDQLGLVPHPQKNANNVQLFADSLSAIDGVAASTDHPLHKVIRRKAVKLPNSEHLGRLETREQRLGLMDAAPRHTEAQGSAFLSLDFSVLEDVGPAFEEVQRALYFAF